MFVVMGTTGEYSDRKEWLVCAYENETLARTHAEEAQKAAARLTVQYGHYHRIELDDDAKKWDADMDFDYTGTDYTVVEVPLRQSLPE